MRSLFLCLFLLKALSSIPCINEKKALLSGEHVVTGPSSVPRGHDFEGNKKMLLQRLQESDSLWKNNHDVDARSDYGATLVYLGRYEEARKLYIELEKTNPGRYATAANLGTVYELLGQNDSALYWIKKAVAVNPQSHYSSEWIHVKILEAKIKGPSAINSNFLINTSFGNDDVPVTTLSVEQLSELKDALNYQLDERMSFVKPKEPIVALLLFELGNVTALADDVTSALRIYDLAYKYGYQTAVLDKRYKHFLDLQAGLHNEYTDSPIQNSEVTVKASTSKNKRDNNMMFVAGGVLIACIVAAFVLVRGKKKEIN